MLKGIQCFFQTSSPISFIVRFFFSHHSEVKACIKQAKLNSTGFNTPPVSMSSCFNKPDAINAVSHHTLGHTLKGWRNMLQSKEWWNISHIFVESYKSSSPIHSLYVLYILRIISSKEDYRWSVYLHWPD